MAARQLERVVARLLVGDTGLKRFTLHTLRSLLTFRRTRRRMTTGPLLNELARRRAVEESAAVSSGLNLAVDIAFNSFSEMTANSEAVTFVESGASRNETPDRDTNALQPETQEPASPAVFSGRLQGRPRRRFIRHLRTPRLVLEEPATPEETHIVESRYQFTQLATQNHPDNQLTVFTASNDKTVREWKLVYRTVKRDMLREEEVRDRVGLLDEGGFGTFIPTTDSDTVAIPLLSLVAKWDIPFRANSVSLHPMKDLLLVVGDHPSALIYSRSMGPTPIGKNLRRPFLNRVGVSIDPMARFSSEPLFSLKGHHDCGFAAAWSPDCFTFATGNDDETINIWDLRHLRSPLVVRKTSISACRSLTYSPNGDYLVSAESEDLAIIYDVKSNYTKIQKVPFFGGCTGAAFSNDGRTLFIGVAAPQKHGGLIELYQKEVWQ
eukprot:Gregarina_sp_Poly_1__1376@NODE_1340_length_4345_cov_84_710145_g900_i0_p1_GENE_NODE_1340_length_4345_cov_84_710145_g900_i0NODE_1340_length_4345_cov_84_710145_g900_i0_p1_ORF_typecomplete_len509_score73_05WD40/PF00400_32/0_78WD40/PF00400_32/9e03WD40/PF00400_32/2_2e05WD40/PF00400_32/0_3WD40/PF00400_32/1_5e02ANAPC4_WD40/PF12894_7/3_8e02ANAPC4_WD40/PF12894_7/0_002ANAPC4_WD40/PF12894_7/0_011ANAPC4_WD40/PF12894_7/1_1e02eIF2A/PF08662_11/1_7e09Cytochrom_D1/PF02239_16/6_3e02Cytochrom_D1/PF02239_16/0_032Cyt